MRGSRRRAPLSWQTRQSASRSQRRDPRPLPRRAPRRGARAAERGRLDAVIAGLLFMAGMRRSEVSALRWSDVAEAADGDGLRVTVRRSKTNPEGEANDVRFVKGGVARAIRTLRASACPEPADRVVTLSPQMVGLRFTAAAAAAGLDRRVTAHSGRVGLASELTSRGASTTDGDEKTSAATSARRSPPQNRAGRRCGLRARGRCAPALAGGEHQLLGPLGEVGGDLRRWERRARRAPGGRTHQVSNRRHCVA